jgi:NADH-quinone oxidoreductase subunit C
MKSELAKEKVERIQARFSDAIVETQTTATDSPIFFVKKDKAIEMLAALQLEEGLEFNFLSDLTAYDDNPPVDSIPDYGLGTILNSGGDHRFVVVYQLLSLQHLDRIRIKVRLKEGEAMPTATGLWKAADWLEREVFDMYGVTFADHPNMRRILLDDRWQGHPQRKDYPMKRYQRFEGSSPLESFGIDKK